MIQMKYSNSDEDFAGESFYAPLWRTNVMNRVLMVIQDNIPEVTSFRSRFLMIFKQYCFRWQLWTYPTTS